MTMESYLSSVIKQFEYYKSGELKRIELLLPKRASNTFVKPIKNTTNIPPL